MMAEKRKELEEPGSRAIRALARILRKPRPREEKPPPET